MSAPSYYRCLVLPEDSVRFTAMCKEHDYLNTLSEAYDKRCKLIMFELLLLEEDLAMIKFAFNVLVVKL
jgi:hypothetical protein